MDELSQQMRTAVASSPPTRIDVDRLIADDRQRRRHRVWALAGAGAAVAVAAVAVAPALLAGPATQPGGLTLPPAAAGTADPSLCPIAEPSASGPPAPQQSYDTVRDRPTERPDAGVARLTGVLRPALAAVVPAGLTVEGTIPGCDQVQFTYEKSHWNYYAHARLVRDGQTDRLRVTLMPTAADEPLGCAAAPDRRACTSRRLPDGSTLATSVSTPGDGGLEQRWVLVERVDGTSVTVTTDNIDIVVEEPGGTPRPEFGPPPVLSVAQLTEIATTPGLTLYP
ncbi:hypothetical protein ACGF5C_33320 [Micromonospora sp. NPDC047620]|uniref:hypothetical protein n=1 Tax=Micromonospora sp. NPDC047620 TaxID=3364251 RepID=UPI0037171E71